LCSGNKSEETLEAQIQKLVSVVSTLIALQIVTLAAVVGVAWYSHSDLKEHLSSANGIGVRTKTPDTVENWASFVRDYNAVQGKEDAAVVVVEYSDFQCPFCKKYSEETRSRIAAKYGDKVRMVFKHYPLEQIHLQAMTAAIAAQCAHREVSFGRRTTVFSASRLLWTATRYLPSETPWGCPAGTSNA
jgi:protein-disulfide isomerase